mgnify:CR=1 FL=1
MGLYTNFFYSKEQEQGESIIIFYKEKIEKIKLDDSIGGHIKNIKIGRRSEEHTSELQSQSTISYAVFCLKKKN